MNFRGDKSITAFFLKDIFCRMKGQGEALGGCYFGTVIALWALSDRYVLLLNTSQPQVHLTFSNTIAIFRFAV